MIEDIRNNIEQETRIINEMVRVFDRLPEASASEQHLLQGLLLSLQQRVKLLNRTAEELMSKMSFAQKLPGKDTDTGVDRLVIHESNERVALKSEDRDNYLQELNISEDLIKRLKKKKPINSTHADESYAKPNHYARLSNIIFLSLSKKLISGGKFKNLNLDLRKANINVLTSTYVSMLFLTSFLAFFVGIGLFGFFLFFNLTTVAPFISLYQGEFFRRMVNVSWVIIAPSAITFMSFYFYPAMQRKSLGGQIEGELPFVVIHMGSISGSGVEPSQIFKIVGLSKEYPATRTEIRKLLNQVNVYGYDLVTALKNVARLTPSQRLAEVFNGLSSAISTGGDLKTFFEKRAETLLLNYRLERERFTKVAETFMDIYISVVIATPMILLLLLVMISVSGVGGFEINQMTLFILFVVGLVNVIFLWVINMRQPSY